VTILNRLSEAQRLWEFALPNIPEPPNETWVRWLGSFSDEEIERAIINLVTRYPREKPEGEDLYRIVTAILVRLRDRRHKRAVQPVGTCPMTTMK
jgi:hypothetical protein